MHSAGRSAYGSSPPSTSGTGSSYTSVRRHRSYTIFDKERYILANFRFVLRHGRQLANSDGSIDWKAVEQVLIPVSEPPICPICLECPPRIPKMTRCGHIFCWTCILQLFDPSVSPSIESANDASPKNRNWRRCPICFEDLHFRQLKSVQFYEASAPKAGQSTSFALLRRHARHLTLQTDKVSAEPFEKTRHQSPSEIIRDVRIDEQSELLAMLAEEHPSDSHKSAIERALTMVEDRIGELSTIADDDSAFASTSSSSENSSPTAKESFYFHQSSNGYPAFLDSLSIKMLRHEFGDYARFPEVIAAPVLEVDEMTIGADFRKRHRYLSHLPIGLVFSSCLLDLSGVVGETTMAAFEKELELRNQIRLRKLRSAHQQTPYLSQSAVALHSSLHEKLYMSEPNIVEITASTDEDGVMSFTPRSPPIQATASTAFSTWSSAAASANMPLGTDDDVNFPSIASVAISKAPEAAIGSPPAFSYIDTTTTQQKEPAKKTPLKFVLVGSSGHRRAR